MNIEKYEIIDRTEFRERLGDYILFRDVDLKFVHEYGKDCLNFFDQEGFDPEYINTIQGFMDGWMDIMNVGEVIDPSYIDIWKVLYEADIGGLISIVKLKVSGFIVENVVVVIEHQQ